MWDRVSKFASGRAYAVVTLIAIASVAIVVAGGNPWQPPTPSPASPPAPPVAPKVRVGYFANIAHAQAVLGVSSGEFAKAIAPAELETRVFNAGPSLIEALFAGEIDLGYIGPGPAINGYVKSRGQGLRVIAGAAANGVAIVAAKDSGIKTLADLKGKRIATPQLGNTQDIAARHYLLNVLKQPDANNIIPIPNAEQLAMMSRGQIDAAWAPEPWAARLVKETGATIIAEEKDLWPDKKFSLALVITTPRFLSGQRDLVTKLLTVHRDWTEKLSKDLAGQTEALGKALNALTGQSLPPEVFKAALSRTQYTLDPIPGTLEQFGKWSYELQFLQDEPQLNGLVDRSVLDSLK